MFYLEFNGKKIIYCSIDAIITAANEIFNKTGIVVGMFREGE